MNIPAGEKKDTVDKILENVDQIYEQALVGKKPLKDILKIDEDHLEAIYSDGYQFNKTGHHVKALKHFRLLMLLDPDNSKFSLALAMVLHQRKYYRQAALAYIVSSSSDYNNPLHWYHLADCYMHLDNALEAYDSLHRVVDIAGDRPEYAHLKGQAKLLIDALDQSGIIPKLQAEEEAEWEKED